MKFIFKILSLLAIVFLLISSAAYFIFFTDGKSKITDIEPPKIITITGNTTGSTGKITTILVTFSDNVNVTKATMHYKSASDGSWSAKSILSGSGDVTIPSDSAENWYYYVTVDDDAGNGPIGDPSSDGSIYYIIAVTESKKDLVHHVFVEEGTATWCSNCPEVADVLHELYDANDPDFYYVSMVEDKNNKANNRLYDDYKILGFPTVYIDGGYQVIMGSSDFKSTFQEKISRSMSREIPSLYLDVRSEWNNSTKELENIVTIENYDDEKYTGRLKVYITEINSPWSDWNGDPY
ncbi:MAG: hypothetical protein JSW62_01180, partial [Thermoplasmatales archaeon]